jgi:hypothetical protein
MVESRDELIKEIAKETELDRMGEDVGEDEVGNDGGDVATPPIPTPHAATPEEIIMEEGLVEMVPEQEAHVAHEVILANAEPEMLQPPSLPHAHEGL